MSAQAQATPKHGYVVNVNYVRTELVCDTLHLRHYYPLEYAAQAELAAMSAAREAPRGSENMREVKAGGEQTAEPVARCR